MRPLLRALLVLVSYAALFIWPAFGAHRRALGVVTETNLGHLDSQDAKVGADIYSCDALDTTNGVDMRVRIGLSQMYLSNSSQAQLEDDGLTIQILAEAGTVAFSEPSTANISVRTPAGIIRAEGALAVAGQITYKGPTELIITAMRGNLTLDNGGQLRTIPEGKSADVTFDDPLAEGCHETGGADWTSNPPHKISFIYIAVPTAAIGMYLYWRELTESESKPER